MAFCRKCGHRTGQQLTLCLRCSRLAEVSRKARNASFKPRERLAAAASYVLFWLTGVLLFLAAKRRFVRYHAAQSMVVFGALQLSTLALQQFLGVSFVPPEWTEITVAWIFLTSLVLLNIVFWLLCMWQASQGRWFKVPGAGEVAEALATLR